MGYPDAPPPPTGAEDLDGGPDADDDGDREAVDRQEASIPTVDCPVAIPAESELTQCVTANTERGALIFVETQYDGVRAGQVFRREGDQFEPAVSYGTYGPDTQDPGLDRIVAEVLPTAHGDALFLELKGAERAFQIVDWTGADELPSVSLDVPAHPGELAVVTVDAVRLINATTGQNRRVRSLTKTPDTPWTVSDLELASDRGATPAIAATRAVWAFQTGNESEAYTYATTEVADALLETSTEDSAWSFLGCTLVDGAHWCDFSFEGGFARLEVEEDSVAAFWVTGLSLTAD